jgi:NACalpha-BTF3-like transcription factor
MLYNSWEIVEDLTESEFYDLCDINCENIDDKLKEKLWNLPYSKNFIIKVITNFSCNISYVKTICNVFEKKKKQYDENIFNFFDDVEELKNDYMNIPNIKDIMKKLKSKFKEKEVNIVSQQSNVNSNLALIAMELHNGDIVNSIMYLTM